MKRLRAFTRRNVLWVGLIAVLVPLLCLIGLQYYSLTKLETASKHEYSSKMDYLIIDVQNEVKYFYKNQANEALTTSSYALTEENLQTKKSLFGKCEVEGARKLFVTIFENDKKPRLYFYPPTDSPTTTQPTNEEVRAVNISTASYKKLQEEDSEIKPMITGYEHDVNNRMLLKPIVNSDKKIIGVTGMMLDIDYFKTVLLPRVIDNQLKKYYPDRARDRVIVEAFENKQKVYASQNAKGQNDKMEFWLPYFSNYSVSIRSKDMTAEQWARWNFKVNLAVSALLTLVLMGGIVLALKTAAREIKLSQMKADFVSNVSHELRTPLASIRVFGEFLKLGRVKDDEKIREYGNYIETESSRLTGLINNILDFSRIESGRKTYECERADLSTIVCDTLRTCDVQLRQNDFNVDIEKPLKAMSHVEIDTEAISQAFLNLVDNAVKYSGESKEIKVKLGQKEKQVFVSVTDFGVGIPHEEQSKIFEKFYRVSTGLVHDVKGSGLGLSLVKHIVESHRGKITIDSEIGKGSTFTIYLPAVDDPNADVSKADREEIRNEPGLELQYRR